MDSIKERVGAYLAKTGRSRMELASDLHVSKTALYQKLNGQTDFSLDEARRLARTLGCSIDDLFVSPIDGSVHTVNQTS